MKKGFCMRGAVLGLGSVLFLGYGCTGPMENLKQGVAEGEALLRLGNTVAAAAAFQRACVLEGLSGEDEGVREIQLDACVQWALRADPHSRPLVQREYMRVFSHHRWLGCQKRSDPQECMQASARERVAAVALGHYHKVVHAGRLEFDPDYPKQSAMRGQINKLSLHYLKAELSVWLHENGDALAKIPNFDRQPLALLQGSFAQSSPKQLLMAQRLIRLQRSKL